MTAVINQAPPLHPPYSHREYSNDIDPRHETPLDIFRRVTLVTLPFLSLYRPMSLPISLGMGAARVYTSGNQLISGIQGGDWKRILFDFVQTTIAVVALASAIFGHPIGMILTTSQDIIFELSNLVESLQKGDVVASLVSLIKILNNALYLALICRGGLELSIVSFSMQAITLVILSIDEFKKGHILEGCGNLLMGAVRVNQACSHFKLLQRQREIEKAVKKIFVGKLREKWQFPSDHLPIGIEVDGVKIISWNVLNSAFMEWITTKDSQGLNGSMISELHKTVKPHERLTLRDLVVVDMVASMMTSGQVIALQECSVPFLAALQARLPSNWQMVKSFKAPRTDQDVILFDTSRLAYRPDQSGIATDAYPSVPNRPLQHAHFSRIKEHGRDLKVVNAHIPGNPNLPAPEEFARYVARIHSDQQITVAVGDYNCERDRIINAFQKTPVGQSKYSVHTPWKGNVHPDELTSKGVDHACVLGKEPFSHDLKTDKVLPGYNLQEMIALLNGAVRKF